MKPHIKYLDVVAQKCLHNHHITALHCHTDATIAEHKASATLKTPIHYVSAQPHIALNECRTYSVLAAHSLTLFLSPSLSISPYGSASSHAVPFTARRVVLPRREIGLG